MDNITGDVLTADGVKRNVIIINGQFPGPSIEVAEGSQVDLSHLGFSGAVQKILHVVISSGTYQSNINGNSMHARMNRILSTCSSFV